VCEPSTSTTPFEFANFLDFVIHVWGSMQLCVTTFNNDWHYFFYFFLFLFHFVCCILCVIGWFLCFRQHSVLKLRGTFFIIMLKWVPCDRFGLQYSREAMLFEEVCGVGKVVKFSCISWCKRFWDLLNLASRIFKTFFFFGVMWDGDLQFGCGIHSLLFLCFILT